MKLSWIFFIHAILQFQRKVESNDATLIVQAGSSIVLGTLRYAPNSRKNSSLISKDDYAMTTTVSS